MRRPTVTEERDMNAAQPALFEVATPAVRVPRRNRTSVERPRWTKYRPRFPMKCDDCMLVLALAKGDGPASRNAKWRRRQGDSELLLCFAHAQARRDEDGMDELPEWTS